MTEYNGGSNKADHLCVLVHGLWGEPKHLASVAAALRAAFSEDELHILVAESNSGYFTYDGIDTGGERVCGEVEETLAAIRARGATVKKLSVIGYSLGGLVARYAVGLLHARGVLDDNLACTNFVTFASPFLGVRSPTRSAFGAVFNAVGARTLSMSGRQLFGIDSFRDTGRPLLAVMADQGSIFYAGLARFQRRTLYANIVNDRSANYYTTCISKTDPFAAIANSECGGGGDVEDLPINFVPGYGNVILDPDQPLDLAKLPRLVDSLRQRAAGGSDGTEETTTTRRRKPSFAKALQTFLANPRSREARMAVFEAAPVSAFALVLPLGLVLFLLNSVYQGVLSSRRRRLHEDGLAGLDIKSYRMPVWMTGLRNTIEDAYEDMDTAQEPEYATPIASEDEDEDDAGAAAKTAGEPTTSPSPLLQPLALSPEQFVMIDNLDTLNWRKYRVWIHNARHSHAAMIVRHESDRFDEGKTVLRHFTNEEFLL